MVRYVCNDVYMNTTTKIPAPRFTTGQRVEVFTYDFSIPGFPPVWKSATVTDVELREDKKWDVMVIADDGTYHPQIVGTRGGNRRVRAV